MCNFGIIGRGQRNEVARLRHWARAAFAHQQPMPGLGPRRAAHGADTDMRDGPSSKQRRRFCGSTNRNVRSTRADGTNKCRGCRYRANTWNSGCISESMLYGRNVPELSPRVHVAQLKRPLTRKLPLSHKSLQTATAPHHPFALAISSRLQCCMHKRPGCTTLSALADGCRTLPFECEWRSVLHVHV